MSEPASIAVIGMACRFPGAPNAEAFWDNIAGDVDSVRKLPPSRFHRERYYDPRIGTYGKSYSDLGGLIEDHPFDGAEFGLSPKVVESTDVAHLWSLEVARDAFLDAGLERPDLVDKNAAVIIGHARGSMLTADMAYATAVEGMLESLERTRLADHPLIQQRIVERVHGRYPRRTEDGGIGTMTSGLAGLISHSFRLTGRHMVVDAACASSFAALDMAARALARGRIDLALTGGASYSQELSVIMFAQSRALSPDGSFPFDRRANGFISSDGIGFFVLKRLEDAHRDGDRIRAVIRGIGGSCDGKGRALWAPRKEGQVLAMKRALEAAAVDPGTIDLIEAHATSTPLGDKTELEAIEEVYGEAARARGRKLPVGSVKGNIGHAREAAGAAALAKVILALEKQVIPPSGNFREPSAEIPWNELCSEVSAAPRAWERAGTVRRAGVSAFGIGGLNYHVIVEEAPSLLLRAESGPSAKAAPAKTARTPKPLDIAIVGMGGVFPGGRRVQELWANLSAKKDLMRDVPADRWNPAIYHQPGERAPYRTYAKRGAFVEGFVADWRRHKVPPKLVERNDPLQFMILESALDALDDAKISLETVDRTRVAVIVGSVFGSDYALQLSLAIRSQELAETVAEVMIQRRDPVLEAEILAALRARLPEINEDSSGSFSSSTLASRTSKTLDLMGPAYAIDAACASSLASLEAACELLRTQGADLALWGGGDRAMRVQRYEGYCQFYALSRTDCVRPFDARADGFLPGEGAAVCVLERLEDAERLGHRIYAVVKGVGSSGDSEKKSMHRASARGLASAITRALGEAQVDPKTIGYVECHGAGTPVGDRAEVDAMKSTLAVPERGAPLLIGSVKSSVGHTQGAAGAIAVLKATLALDKGEVPPTFGFESPHPEHRFEDALRVNTEVEPFPASLAERVRGSGPAPTACMAAHTMCAGNLRRAGVSSMGLAGINYHVVLERPVKMDKPLAAPPAGPQSLALEGDAVARLVGQPGFEEFWDRVRPSIAGFVTRMWSDRSKPIVRRPEPLPGSVRILRLSGTAREIGRAHGESLREEIQDVLQRYQAFLGDHGIAMLEIPEAIDRLSGVFDRPSLDELEGLAEGAAVPFRHLFAYNLDAALFPAYVAGCTQAVRLASENGGELLHLANEDSPLLLHLGGRLPRVIQIRTRTDARDPEQTTVIFSAAGQSGGPNGANDRGLTVTSTTLLDGPETPEGGVEGLPHPQLVKAILENASTLDEALKIAKSTPRTGRWSLLCSDAGKDEAAYLEYDGARILMEDRVRGARVTTNHALSGPAEGCEAPEHSRLRAERAEKLLLGAPLAVEGARRALRDRFDLGRGREVPHPTMNTVRRVDNVMSLIVEPVRRTLHVTTRVAEPGRTDEVDFETISYGRPLTVDIEPLAEEGAGIARVEEVMERYVVRAIEAPLPASTTTVAPRALLLVGTGPRADEIAARFRERGSEVTQVRDALEAIEQVRSVGGPKRFDAMGLLLAGEGSEWLAWRRTLIEAPFRLIRAWAPEQSAGLLFAVTALGGALGFDNANQCEPLGGALVGLFKALRRELGQALTLQILDASPLESPQEVAAALLRQLDSGSGLLEVGLLRGKRMRLVMAPRRAQIHGTERLPRTWLVTGGGRGVTARIALRLAELYRPVLHLVGKHVLPEAAEVERLLALDDAALDALKRSLLEARMLRPLDWRAECDAIDKTREVARTLRAIAAAGSEVHYHGLDVKDPEALGQVLDKVRALGPLEGIIHGAGVEIAKALPKKTDEIFDATISPKIDGLVNLLSLTGGDPITHLAAFSSVSGRFGGYGQTDYAMANEALARILGAHRAQRPDRKVVVLSWAAFGETGLAARSSAKTFLEQSGQRFMSPDEGANHFIRELWAGAPEPEVTICEAGTISTLDLDHDAPDPASRPAYDAMAARAAEPILAAGLLYAHPQESRFMIERTLLAREPFLDEHRLEGVPILPAVMAADLLRRAASLDGKTWTIESMRIHTPLKVSEGGSRTIRIRVDEASLQLSSSVHKPDGTVVEPDRVYVSAVRRLIEEAQIETALGELFDRCPMAVSEPAVRYPYADGTEGQASPSGIFHGRPYRCVLGVKVGDEGGRASIAVPEIPELFFDGCLQATGLLARAILGRIALPRGFGRVLRAESMALATGDELTAHIRFRAPEPERVIADFVVTSLRGVPVFGVEGYEAEVVPER